MIKNKVSEIINLYGGLTDKKYDDVTCQCGEICGANIKPINVDSALPGIDIIGKIKWGIFIHVRMENGDQIDLVFRHSITVKSIGFPGIVSRDFKKKRSVRIPDLLMMFDVNEWVELFGKKLYIFKVTKDDKVIGVSIRLSEIYGNRLSGNSCFASDYFEIIPGKFNN